MPRMRLELGASHKFTQTLEHPALCVAAEVGGSFRVRKVTDSAVTFFVSSPSRARGSEDDPA